MNHSWGRHSSQSTQLEQSCFRRLRAAARCWRKGSRLCHCSANLRQFWSRRQKTIWLKLQLRHLSSPSFQRKLESLEQSKQFVLKLTMKISQVLVRLPCLTPPHHRIRLTRHHHPAYRRLSWASDAVADNRSSSTWTVLRRTPSEHMIKFNSLRNRLNWQIARRQKNV